MMKIVWFVPLMLLIQANRGATLPAASFSISLDSMNSLLRSVVPKIIATQLNPEHILVDYYEIPTAIGPVIFKNIHMHDYIDFTRTKMQAEWADDKKVYFYIINATMQFDMEYEMFQFRLLQGNAEAKITDLSLWTQFQYIDNGDSWSCEVTQQAIKLRDVDLNMHNPILDFIFQVIKHTLLQSFKNVLNDHIFPRWNQLIQRFINNSQDPNIGAVYFPNSDYFVSLNVIEKPVLNRMNDYIEVQFNGLTYKKQDMSTIATNDIDHAYRDLSGKDEQLNLSDNALQSFTPYLLKQIPSAVELVDQDNKFKSFFQDLLPPLIGLFGLNATYSLTLHYGIPEPSYVISKGVLTMKDVSVGVQLVASNCTISNFNAVRFNFEMTSTITGFINNFRAFSEIKINEMKADSFSIDSSIGDVGVSQHILQVRIQYLMEYLVEQLTYAVNNQDLSELVPQRFLFLLDDIRDVSAILHKDEHFVHIGFNSS